MAATECIAVRVTVLICLYIFPSSEDTQNCIGSVAGLGGGGGLQRPQTPSWYYSGAILFYTSVTLSVSAQNKKQEVITNILVSE